jgi:DNA-binding CsgD family transcriptional regulator
MYLARRLLIQVCDHKKELAVNDRLFAVPEVVHLTPRESDVIRLIAHGCTYVQVADRLGVSAHTVASHVKNAYRKLGVRSGAAAVMRAVELKFLGEN